MYHLFRLFRPFAPGADGGGPSAPDPQRVKGGGGVADHESEPSQQILGF